MIEGEGPDILQQLSADLPSVEAHEQQERRAFQIREVARVLQIPDDSVEANATVARYVTVLRDAQAGWERLRGSRTKDVLEGEPLLQERTGQAAALYHAEQVILEEGFGYGVVPEVRPIHLDPSRGTSLTSLLDRAAEPHGLTVDVPEGWEKQRFHDVVILGKPFHPTPEPAVGLWTGAPLTTAGKEPWPRESGYFSEWYWPDMPNERHDPEHLRALAEEAARHGIAPDRPRVDPAMHTLLTGLVYGRQLVEETQGLESLPPAPGLTPPAVERLSRAAPLNRLAVAVLEDAVRPGSLTADRVAGELTPVVSAYGLVLKGQPPAGR